MAPTEYIVTSATAGPNDMVQRVEAESQCFIQKQLPTLNQQYRAA
jgi:hypothetical protein